MGGVWANNNWGNCNWDDGNVNINNNNNFNKNYNKNVNKTGAGQGNSWQHNPQHRGNAPYANKQTANKYGGKAAGGAGKPGGPGGAGGVGGAGSPAVQVALAVPENPVVPAVRVVLAALEKRRRPRRCGWRWWCWKTRWRWWCWQCWKTRRCVVALAVLENPVVPAALARLAVAALLNQVEVVEKEALTRSVAINRREAAVAVAPSLAGVGALLKPRAAEVAVA